MSPVKELMSRREKIAKASSTVFVAVAIAAVLVAFSLVSIRFLWQRKSYNDRVITAKSKADNAIKTNIANIGKLTNQFPTLEQSPTANSKIILHALPPIYDYAALATSVQFLANKSGVTFNGGIGTDNSAAAAANAPTSTPVEIPLTLTIEGSYGPIVQFIQNLEYSIRPMNVTAVTYTGTNSDIKATITATTYYQPARSLDVTKSEVK